MSDKQGTKRLRGWKKDLATGLAERPDAQEQLPSPFATKLLSHWAHGKLSAKGVQELAHLAQIGGCAHEEVATIARAGNFGENPGNCTKALMSAFLPNVGIPPGLDIEVPCLDPKTSKESVTTVQVFLPHSMFSALAENYPRKWEQFFCTHDLAAFWSQVEAKKDQRLKGHPLTKGERWQETTVPLFCHGDGAEFQTRDSLMIYSFGSIQNLLASLDSHLLMACFPKSCTTPQTWQPLWEYLAWSFESLQKGYHPTKDWTGEPLKKGSPFYPMRGRPLTPGTYKGTLWTIIGDQEFFSNHLRLPHWRNKQPCHMCNCTSQDGDLPYTCLEPEIFTLVDNDMAKAHPRSDHPIFKIPGITSLMCRGDGLHILFTKGIYAHTLGSILHYLCWYDPIHGLQKVKPANRLAIIFAEVQKHYRVQGAGTQLTNLKLSMFTSEKAPHQNYASLDAKGGECKWLAPALLEVIKTMLSDDLDHHVHMKQCLEALVQLVCLWDSAPAFLSDGQCEMVITLMNAFLQHYTFLNDWASKENRKLFHKVNKHHSFIHLCLGAGELNPRLHWCFKSEDFVGHISRLGHSCSPGVASTKLSTKLLTKYRVLLHLLLTREGFTLD